MDFVFLRAAIAIAGTAYLAWQDARTSFMDERVLWAMIAAGALLDLATLDVSFILPSIGLAALMLVVGWFSYRSGAIGGGDVLLAVALQLLIPFRPNEITGWFLGLMQPQADFGSAMVYGSVLARIPPIASVVVATCVLAMLGTAAYYAWRLKGRKLEPDKIALGASVAAIIAVGYALAGMTAFGASAIAFMFVVMFAAAFLSIFYKQIFNEIIVEQVPLSKIEDEDILATEKMDAKIVAKYGIGKLLDKEGLEKVKSMMEKEKLKTIPVAKSLPRLGPYILLGLVITLLVGDVLAFLMLFS